MISDIAISLVAAVIGAALLWLWQNHLLPGIRGRLRQLPKLNGTNWQREGPSGLNESVLTISQSGTRIHAKVTRNERRQRTYSYVGELSGHQLVLTWEDTDSREQMIGAMVLHLSADLTKLSGHSVYFKQNSGEVVAVHRVYRRKL